jgi:hypothetical protein
LLLQSPGSEEEIASELEICKPTLFILRVDEIMEAKSEDDTTTVIDIVDHDTQTENAVQDQVAMALDEEFNEDELVHAYTTAIYPSFYSQKSILFLWFLL